MREWLAAVNKDASSLSDAVAGIDDVVDNLGAGGTTPPVGPDEAEDIYVGGDPTFSGNDKSNNIIAGTGQLNDNSIIDGKGGNDVLDVTIRGDEAIAPTVRNVEKVVVRGQEGTGAKGESATGHTDNNVWDYATIDADRFTGVNWWESNRSRADVKIEDVRILDNQITKDITIAFRDSNPGHVDYAVYFEQPALRNQTSQTGILRAALYDSVGAANNSNILESNPYTRIIFSVDGKFVDINFGEVKGS
ncbi:MAG: hypothetical protein LBB55_06905, partial [Zoogloeaceae bacterium]|nr:hypothetical protein [Zoogloeaceae bacterium]